jgi:hypothetical protein
MRRSRLSRWSLLDLFRPIRSQNAKPPATEFSLEAFYRGRAPLGAGGFPVVQRRSGLPALPSTPVGAGPSGAGTIRKTEP